MPQPTKGTRLGGSPAHQRLMLANLATELFRHGKIQTTETKAKRLRPFAERLVTFAKRGDLSARRRVVRVVRDPEVVHNLFAEVGPRFATRPGGYTRIVKLGPRKGDNAPMALIELVDELVVEDAPAAKKAKRTERRRFRKTESMAALAGEDEDTAEAPAKIDADESAEAVVDEADEAAATAEDSDEPKAKKDE